MRSPRNRRGMTMVELVFSISILSMVTICMMSMVMAFLRGSNSSSATDTLGRHATVALYILSNDVRDATTAAISSGRLVVSFPRIITDSTTGERVYDLSTTDPLTRTYFVSNGSLMRTYNGTTTVLAKGIDSATFGASGGIVTITLKATQTLASDKTLEREVRTRVALRNFRS